ncbi:anaphase-promoting complex subunit 11 RING-H2 finger-domain-containing protein [Hyaloscypha finlandica]|nr:anaphase-promoting complex subunit 11 RING-H2 finger-domain-containing protein [Hyaloscypha finlandica]
MKVKIKKWNAVATWRWDIPDDDVCGICQVHFDGTCPTCKYPGDDCSLRMSIPSHLPLPPLSNSSSLRQMRT